MDASLHPEQLYPDAKLDRWEGVRKKQLDLRDWPGALVDALTRSHPLGVVCSAEECSRLCSIIHGGFMRMPAAL